MSASQPASPLHRRGLWLLALALVAAAAAGLLLFNNRGGSHKLPAEGGTLVENDTGPVERVNPLLAVTPAEHDLAALVFAGLTRRGPAGEAAPDLAESWQVSEDGRTFTFRLRRDVSWQDGAPIGVEDVLFTIGLIQAGATNDARLAEVWRGASVERVDERTVRVQLPSPFAPLPAYASFGLLPEHLLRDVQPEALGTVPFNRRPVGAGPFRLLDLTDSAADLARYDRYHLGAPYLDRIQLRFDNGGGADAAVLDPGSSSDGRITFPLAVDQYAAVMLNNDAPLFAADTVRRALSFAVDRKALTSSILGGAALPTDVPFAPGSWAHDGTPVPGQDLDAARALLAASGWSAGPDGVLRRGNRDLRFTLLTVDEPAWVALARALADAWGQIGARVVVAPTSQNTLLSDFLQPRQYEAALIGWDPGPDPDPFTAWHSSLRGKPGGNPANFADERADALLVEGRVIPDLEMRQASYAAFQARFRELAPSIILFSEVVRYAVRDGYQLSLPAAVGEPSDRFSDVRRWYTHTRSGP